MLAQIPVKQKFPVDVWHPSKSAGRQRATRLPRLCLCPNAEARSDNSDASRSERAAGRPARSLQNRERRFNAPSGPSSPPRESLPTQPQHDERVWVTLSGSRRPVQGHHPKVDRFLITLAFLLDLAFVSHANTKASRIEVIPAFMGKTSSICTAGPSPSGNTAA